MFDQLSYLGYTALVCVPLLLLLWLRREFYAILAKDARAIALSTIILTAYGCVVWPIALELGAWAYGPDKLTGIRLLGILHLEDLVWWIVVSLLFASFISVSAHYEEQGVDIVLAEAAGLLASFRHAFAGFRLVPLERNTTIHVAITAFVVLEALLFRISAMEWLFVGVAIGSVLGLELLNSALERLASKVSPHADAEIGLIKDAAASGVLVAAAAAALIGVVILLSRVVTALA